jgi:hypothetical protein
MHMIQTSINDSGIIFICGLGHGAVQQAHISVAYNQCCMLYFNKTLVYFLSFIEFVASILYLRCHVIYWAVGH